MKLAPAVLGAVLAATALAAPAAADLPGQDLVYSVTAEHPDGADKLRATCVFRPDRWTADYGPTYVDAVATTVGAANHTYVGCRIYTWGSPAGQVSEWANGPVATIRDARLGAVATSPNVTICVDAETQYFADVRYSVTRCVNP